MLDIKKKIIAIALVCAMSLSMAACSDKGSKNNIKTETLSSEEAEQLKRVEFSFAKFTDAADTAQDPVEGVELNVGNYQGDSNNSSDSNAGDNNSNENADSSNAGGNEDGNNNNAGGGNNNGSGGNSNNNGGSAGGNNSNAGGNNNNTGGSGNNNNNSDGNASNDSSNDPSGSESAGTEEKQQIFWMDLSGDFVFDGEFAYAVFKIKDTAPNGTYPVSIKWLDFSNIKAVSLDATGIDGSVVVGGSAAETQFKNDGSFEVKADSVSGKPGDTVTVSFRFKNNPGICASVFRFAYDSDVLEFDEEASGMGSDFANALETQNK